MDLHRLFVTFVEKMLKKATCRPTAAGKNSRPDIDHGRETPIERGTVIRFYFLVKMGTRILMNARGWKNSTRAVE